MSMFCCLNEPVAKTSRYWLSLTFILDWRVLTSAPKKHQSKWKCASECICWAIVAIRNIPAHLPYEAKQALLRKLRANRNHRQLDHMEVPVPGPAVPAAVPSIATREVRANYPQPRESHFLYGGHSGPITGYRLPDGSIGNVDSHPRK